MTRPPKRKRLTPQQKKALSYARDHRSSHGQNDKASRRLIPLHKAQEHRTSRRVDKAALNHDPETAAPTRKRGEWRKWPDLPLGADLEYGHFGDNRPHTPEPFDKTVIDAPYREVARRVRRRVQRVLKGQG